jgi:hypothetical protein
MIEKSKNQHSSNIIALSVNDKASDKALDKALVKHASKQVESTSQSIESIIIQLNNYTNIQLNKLTKEIDLILSKGDKVKEKKKDIILTWRNNFEAYLANARQGYGDIVNDKEFILLLEDAYPNIDAIKSIKNSFKLYWATDEGWEKKKSVRKTASIDWKSTIRKGIKLNAVYMQNSQKIPEKQVYTPSEQYKPYESQ